MSFHIPNFVPLVTDDKQITAVWKQTFTNLFSLLNVGVPLGKNGSNGQNVPQSATIPIAKLTTGGTNGSLTFTNGILSAYVVPT
jgi:hypothetical protein